MSDCRLQIVDFSPLFYSPSYSNKPNVRVRIDLNERIKAYLTNNFQYDSLDWYQIWNHYMASAEKLLRKIRQSRKNVKFNDAKKLVLALGFELDRTKGSHFIFKHPAHETAFLNLQESGGEAKPYQLKQILNAIDEYQLEIE